MPEKRHLMIEVLANELELELDQQQKPLMHMSSFIDTGFTRR